MSDILQLSRNGINAISPFKEMIAYEAIWKTIPKMSFKKLVEKLRTERVSKYSDLIDDNLYEEYKNAIAEVVKHSPIKVNTMVHFTIDYPKKLRDAKEPIELLYYSGNLSLLNTKSLAVVGARKATKEGILRTQKLVRELVKDKITIVSGLAEGIDTAAHTTALAEGGQTIAVIGTPLNHFYPKHNRDLQIKIAKEHLLISQVPFLKYVSQDYRYNRMFFPERNKTMSAISDGTIIVEASETSGSLIQAEAALAQKRKLFILQSCFENTKITWPEKFEKMGAIRVREYSDIQKHL